MGQETCEYFLTIKTRLGKTTTALPSTDLHVLHPVDIIGIMLNQQNYAGWQTFVMPIKYL